MTRVKENRGFHSKVSGPCIECHTEHKGEDFNIMPIDDKKFDHALTGFALEDKHKISCNKCHKKEKTFMGLTEECLGCHTDVHQKTLTDCLKCHSFKGWKGLHFDHDRFSQFKLTGKHTEVKCVSCHPEQPLGGNDIKADKVTRALKFKPLKYESCENCHKSIHKEEMKEKACSSCHTTQGWKEETFDHNDPLLSRYPLEREHKNASCVLCHPEQKTTVIIDGKPTERMVKKFKPTKHEQCNGCHFDIHKGQLKERRCDDCHSAGKKWKEHTFGHEASAYKGFKLDGKHKEVDCKQCHGPIKSKFTEFNKQKNSSAGLFKPIKHKQCNDCHTNIHKDLKEKTCESCHSTKGWKEPAFDHNNTKLSDFKLEGSHSKVSCELCHPDEKTITKTMGKEVEKTVRKLKPIKHALCSECHFDVHQGQFKNSKCDSCHTAQEKWKNITFKHESKDYTGFKLEGKHKEVACEKCHPQSETSFKEFSKNKQATIGKFRPLKSGKCDDCHFDVHKEQFKDRKCDDCHTVQDKWKGFTFKHESGGYKGFKLDGKHKNVACEKCHVRSDIKFTEFGSQKQVSAGKFRPIEYTKCISCHEDKHNGKFEKACEKCHIPDGWEPRKFLHDPLTSELQGVHNTLSCGECHKQAKLYKGLDSNCASCHKDVHFNQFGRFCGDCHRQQSWIPPDFKHTGVGFSLVGGHRKADCTDCHKNGNYRNTPTDCFVCHQADYQSAPNHATSMYPHDCTECHQTSGTWEQVSVSHDSFSFLGAHASLKGDCETCHASSASVPAGTTESDCYNCHVISGVASATSYEKASDPSHSVNNFDRICTTCHTEVTWSNAKYSHKSFQFLGVHGTLTCNNCHQSGYPGTIAGVASDHCYTCHAAFFQSAPNHVSGGYPHDCTACHSTTGSWSNVKAYTHTSFTFNGAHATIKTTCTECHITGKTIPAGTTNDACNNCHSTAGVATTKYESVTSPSHVTNSFSRTCADCHTNTTWTSARYAHRSFQFSGIHSTLTCTTCHSSGYPGTYAGMAQDNCNACHAANYQSAPNHRFICWDCPGQL
ncbi:MAG: hypothetical protein HZC49_01995 [Nitrospirae bacterium]|nr:hypothetical protein [Nitrospirota bacterium]